MVRNHHKRAGDSRSQANPLPWSSSFSLEGCAPGGHMAKRMEFPCILFTVPTALEQRASTSEPLSRVSSTRRQVPCSAEMDKIGRYACLSTVAFTPRSAFRTNVFCWTWSVC